MYYRELRTRQCKSHLHHWLHFQPDGHTRLQDLWLCETWQPCIKVHGLETSGWCRGYDYWVSLTICFSMRLHSPLAFWLRKSGWGFQNLILSFPDICSLRRRTMDWRHSNYDKGVCRRWVRCLVVCEVIQITKTFCGSWWWFETEIPFRDTYSCYFQIWLIFMHVPCVANNNSAVTFQRAVVSH